jgi:hypothetical protein
VGRGHDGSDGDHGVGVYAGEDDDARGRSSKFKTSQEQKRGRCLEGQNLMMVHSNLVLFLATVILEEEEKDVSNSRALQHGGECDAPKYHTYSISVRQL